jgi:hypothetical protein
MAQATVYPFSQFLVKLGNGASPEVFSDPCGLTTRGFTRTAALNDTNVPDCSDPDAPSWLGPDVVSYSAQISGAGVVAEESYSTWEDWWNAGETRNVQISLGSPPIKTWLMPAKLADIAITAERGHKVAMTVTLQSDGAVVPSP